MTLKNLIISLFLIYTAPFAGAQDINLYQISLHQISEESYIPYVSLSDTYPINENPDSLAIPINNPEDDHEKFEYFELEGNYRKNFLMRSGFSEKDKLFIYDYSRNVLKTFNVKELKLVACLTIYGADWPYSQYDYRIGFELDKRLLNGYDNYFSNSLVSIGKVSPFNMGKITNIQWNKIDNKTYPSEKISLIDLEYINSQSYLTGNIYSCEIDTLVFYMEELIQDNWSFGKRIMVLNRKTKEKILEKIYYAGESASFADIEYQWTGKLFKNKPNVIFGFLWESFGCERITFMDNFMDELYIYCDNRH